jgi:hypothetical protein
MKHTAPPKTNIVYLQNAELNSCYKVINIFVQYNGIIPLMVFKSAVYFFVWRYLMKLLKEIEELFTHVLFTLIKNDY